MKLNKSKNKGKVHPSPFSSSSSSASNHDPVSSLNHLLPTAIFTLISVLSLQDREALAYMITHSLKSSTLNYCNYCPSSSCSSSFDPKIKKKSNKKSSSSSTGTNTKTHVSPSFDCCCFDCFSHFWNRWDSSPHSELIHQAIEAFEEHLSSSEKKTITTPKSKKKKDNGRRREKVVSADVEERESPCVSETGSGSSSLSSVPPENLVVVGREDREEVQSPEILVLADVEERETEEFSFSPVFAGDGEEDDEESGPHQELQQQEQHKGLARKVLPDVIGLFHSRFWKNLWGPNV
ncbi:hypothetical protein SOVF_004920 [Spinacia oleracea]|uniref:C2H2-type domain-containing protein n=1 Tax=Spinacia oleracea TaxID=3562 RepID=A0A9R0JTE5_SPIOL|nr:uncharacterized protein LOC110785724 [Spinacia oleracea]KNA25624.1 hypothetical protein SOVF_004920 [Spinacia oleracea]